MGKDGDADPPPSTWEKVADAFAALYPSSAHALPDLLVGRVQYPELWSSGCSGRNGAFSRILG